MLATGGSILQRRPYVVGMICLRLHLLFPQCNVMKRFAPSKVAARTYFSFGEYRTHETGGLPSANNVFMHCPLPVSQKRLPTAQIDQSHHVRLDELADINPSWLPVTKLEPSLLNFTEVTGSLWASIVRTVDPEPRSKASTCKAHAATCPYVPKAHVFVEGPAHQQVSAERQAKHIALMAVEGPHLPLLLTS
jgi:hypothetical protein